MRPGETDYRGKFWVGQRVRVLNVPGPPEDVLCDTGRIKSIRTKFERTPDLQTNEYEVRIDGHRGMFKKKILVRVYVYGTNGDHLEIIEDEEQD